MEMRGQGGIENKKRAAETFRTYLLRLIMLMLVVRVKVKLHYAYKVRNIGRVRPRLRFCVLC